MLDVPAQMNAAVQELLETLGPDLVKTGAAIPERNSHDAAELKPIAPRALVLPRTVEHVSKTLAICHAHRQPVVTQGGLTGLAGGAHPDAAEVALSLERMVGVEEIDLASSTLTAWAGTPLQVIQEAAAAAGLLCGIDLGARGSCSIGGNVATNAGGNQVLRYGMARKNVLGLEVVQADGAIVRSLNKMMKNNAGYDWTQLFIGSEGTLGIITRVVLGLHARPQGVRTALLAVRSTDDALGVLRTLQSRVPGGVLVFEGMWREMYAVATTQVGLAAPLPQGHDLYLLIEIAGGEGDAVESALERLYEQDLIIDAVIAKSESERAKLWALRESIYEYGRVMPKSIGFDISIPLDRIAKSVERFRHDLTNQFPDAIAVIYGHIADANLHIMVMPEVYSEAKKLAVTNLIYDITGEVGGSISAEHGIGRVKRAYLPRSRSAAELALMRTIKAALDPNDILNRGRVLLPP